MENGFIKLMRTPEAETLARTDPNAFAILTVAALRASREGNKVSEVRPGESFIGFTDFKMTRQKYREALKRLKKWGFATSKGTNKGTVISIDSKEIYDINMLETTNKTTDEQPSDNQPTTTIKKGKKDKKEEKRKDCPVGVSQETWTEYLKTRTGLKAPNTDRAILTLTNKITKLVNQGYNAEELVATANMNGWKSVWKSGYEPNDRTNRANPTPRELASAMHTPTFFDTPIDLQQPFCEAGREPGRQIAAVGGITTPDFGDSNQESSGKSDGLLP